MTYVVLPLFCSAGGREFKSRRNRTKSKYHNPLNKSLATMRGFYVSILIIINHYSSNSGHIYDGHTI